MKIGYARTSTLNQNLDLQLDALHQAGCTTIYQEKVSSVKDSRPELENCLKTLREGDILYIWRLDRLGRSLKDLIKLVNEIHDKGCGLVSLKENINTSTPTGKLTSQLFSSLAEFEKDLNRERTRAGMLAARSRGRKGGRPAKLTEADKAMIRKLMSDRNNSAQDIAERFNISRATVYTVAKGVELVLPDDLEK